MSGIIKKLKIIEGENIVFVITGGGSGVGRALALALAKRGRQVLVIGRRDHLIQETASLSSHIVSLCADVSTQEGLQAIKHYTDSIPLIEGLINNAGSLEPIVALKDIKKEEWQQTLKTNLDAPLFLSQMLLKQLENGRVLNIGSGAAYFAIKGWGAYCVSKAALSMLTRCWQLESETVAFASVTPGIIDTDMQAIARESSHMDSEQADFYRRLKNNNRLISTETLAEFLTWLLLDTDKDLYISQEWDIYDTAHHDKWLKPPHQVLHWDH